MIGNPGGTFGIETRLRNRRPRNHAVTVGRCKASRQVLGPNQPSIQWVPVSNWVGVEGAGHVDDMSPPTSEEIEDVRCHSFTLPLSFVETMLNESQGIFLYTSISL